MKLACADFTFPLLSHEHSLDLIAMLGFDGVDIGLFEGRSHLTPKKEFAKATAAKVLKQKASDRGLKIADVFLQVDQDFQAYAINHPEHDRREHARDWFLRTLEYARDCGCKHVTALPGAIFDIEVEADSLGRAREELAWRVEQAKSMGVLFGTEAHVGSIVPTPEKALSLVESVPGLTLTLDYTHFTRDGLPDTDVQPLLAFASHFHVRGARKGRLQCSFAENTIDYGHVIDQLIADEYPGYLGIEFVWIDWEHCNEVDNLSETILFRDAIRSRSF